MLFSSISFIYYFLAAVLLLYFIVPFRFKNFVLFLSSFAFYFYGEPIYTLLMIATTLSSYIHGLLIGRFRGTKWAKVFLWSSVVTSIAVLGFFKYADFFIENLNNLFGGSFDLLGIAVVAFLGVLLIYRFRGTKLSLLFSALTVVAVVGTAAFFKYTDFYVLNTNSILDGNLLGIALPIGISFYTFQTLSYTIDVYRGEAQVQRNFIHLATYVALFPQLIAGPIVRYTTVEEDLATRTHSFEKFASGMTRFLIGLAKKVIIADTFGNLIKSFIASDNKSVAFYWLYAAALCLQLYFDFSGYSDMAIGLGRIFGFRFLENFNYPFISRSVAEFWRRWHMSLGTWFRDYVYIPLGGNRVGKWRWLFNTLVVWLLTGFWHGADWVFIVWGLYFALFLLLEKFFLGNILKKIPRVFSHIYVLLVIIVSFVLFSASGMSGAISDIGAMFGAGDIPLWSAETAYYLRSYGLLFAISIFGATPILKNTVLKIKENRTGNMIMNLLEPIFQIAVLLVVTSYFVDGSFSAFLYFRF